MLTRPDVDVLAYRWQLTQAWRAFHAVSHGRCERTDWSQYGYYRDFIDRDLLLPGVQRMRDDERKARHEAYRLSLQSRDTEQLELF